MTRRDLELIKQQFQLSTAVIKRNTDIAPELSRPKSQQAVRHEPLAAVARKESRPSRARQRVAIICLRCRLQDSDNCCVKYVVDALRHEQLIPDDSPEHIILEVRQQKVAHKSEEGTLVEITPCQ